MSNTLVYVDRELSVAIASKLIGLQSQETLSTGGGTAFNWLIQANVSYDEGRSITQDIRELLPEEVMYEIYGAIEQKYKFTNVEECVMALSDVGDNRILPGRPISVKGIMSFPEIRTIGNFDPFSPPDINIQSFHFHGEKCIVGKLQGDGFKIPVYFLEAAKNQVCFCDEQPVEVTGIVRWSPAYSPGGAKSLILALRTAALWLR